MTRDVPGAEPQLQRLLEQAKTVRPVPQATRARVLRRAQSQALLGAPLDTPKVPWPRSGASPLSWVGGAAVVVGLVGAGVALELRKPPVVDHAPSAAATTAHVIAPAEPVPAAAAASTASASVPSATATVEASPASRPARAADSYLAELTLLRAAQAAYGSHDFASALRLLAEHARRFPSGRLSEEREALRVRALSGSGQGQAASVAARAFAVRFPRSVLLSRTLAAAKASE